MLVSCLMFTPPRVRFGHNQEDPRPTMHRIRVTRDKTGVGFGEDQPPKPTKLSDPLIHPLPQKNTEARFHGTTNVGPIADEIYSMLHQFKSTQNTLQRNRRFRWNRRQGLLRYKQTITSGCSIFIQWGMIIVP